MPQYKLPADATNRAIVDDVELEIGGEAQTLTPDQAERLQAIGVVLETDSEEL